MKGRLLLIAGSSAANTPSEKIKRAHTFVRLLVRRVVERGGGLVLFAGGEPAAADGEPLIFDWTVLRELADLPTLPSMRTVVVTSEKARSKKMTADQRKLLAQLASRGIVDIVSIPSELHTGGNIGDEQAGRAMAMVALGGGKGVADRAWKLRKLGKPVLPFDLELGALSADGDGAVGLHRDFVENPAVFFPATGDGLRSQALSLSLETPVMDLEELADRSLGAIEAEIEMARLLGPPDVLLLTALPVELGSAREVFGAPLEPAGSTESGTRFWRARVGGEADGRVVVLSSFGGAGNVDAAVVTAGLVSRFKPRAVIMVGIGAGMREKCRLGEVVISERIVAYEGAALTTGAEGPRTEARPEQYRAPHAIQQALTAYLSNAETVRARLRKAYRAASVEIPKATAAGVPAQDVLPRLVTLASGEKLLRDPEKFRSLRQLHGKVEAVEMEAVGVARACETARLPYIIVRGISDHGDEKKDDRFHAIAAKAAAVVALDLTLHCLG